MAPVIFLVSAVTLVVIRRLRSAGDTDNVGPPPPQDPGGGGARDEYLQLEGGGGHTDSAVIYTTSEAPGGVGAGAGAGYPWPGKGPGRGDYCDPRVRTQAHVKLNPLFHQYS